MMFVIILCCHPLGVRSHLCSLSVPSFADNVVVAMRNSNKKFVICSLLLLWLACHELPRLDVNVLVLHTVICRKRGSSLLSPYPLGVKAGARSVMFAVRLLIFRAVSWVRKHTHWNVSKLFTRTRLFGLASSVLIVESGMLVAICAVCACCLLSSAWISLSQNTRLERWMFRCGSCQNQPHVNDFHPFTDVHGNVFYFSYKHNLYIDHQLLVETVFLHRQCLRFAVIGLCFVCALFDSTLGYPGEGPPKSERKRREMRDSDSDQEVHDEGLCVAFVSDS